MLFALSGHHGSVSRGALSDAVWRALQAGGLDRVGGRSGATPAAIDLVNGVVVTGLTGAAGSDTLYRLVVPENATGPLSFRTYTGSGNVSLYVSLDEVPTTTAYDWRSSRPGNNETIVIADPAPGMYYVLVRGETAYSGVRLVATHGLSETYSNNTAYPIPDNSAAGVDSPIAISGASGNASAETEVYVNITHTWIGDLIVTLVAPDGSQIPYPVEAPQAEDFFVRATASEAFNRLARVL